MLIESPTTTEDKGTEETRVRSMSHGAREKTRKLRCHQRHEVRGWRSPVYYGREASGRQYYHYSCEAHVSYNRQKKRESLPHNSGIYAILQSSSEVESFKAKESNHAILLMQQQFRIVNYKLQLGGPSRLAEIRWMTGI